MSDNDARTAEQARQDRDGEPDNGTVRVKVTTRAVTINGTVHEPGSTFTAPSGSVDNAISRGLVERAEKAKR